MSTVVTPVAPPAVPPVSIPADGEQRFILRDADWDTYQGFLAALGERHVRVTYDRGCLELMTLSHRHERISHLLAQVIQILSDELDLPRQSGGSTTFSRKDLDRGLEPDQCYYLANEPRVRNRDEIDLNVDPPPDLVIEVEVSRSALNRLGIYAALGVFEVWRCDGENVHVYHLIPPAVYALAPRSRFFPMLPPEEIGALLRRRGESDEMALMKSFRAWVRDQVARGWPTA
jgi:Uma2 family endonuclease